MLDTVTSERDDTRRLEALALYNILDTPSEPEFDDIVLLAGHLCHAPVALVSLLDRDRQWFKARLGFDRSEGPIEQSVCQHALSSPDVLVIPDLTLDPRTNDNIAVTSDPHFRFYAGAPLISAEGVPVGTLCVIDYAARPNGLTEMQRKSLSALARQVVVLLEMRHTSSRKDDLFRRQKRISSEVRAIAASSIAAQEAGGIGTFDIDIASGRMKISAEGCRIFRLPVQDEYPADVIYDFILPEDRHLPSADKTRADGSAMLEAQYRIVTPREGIRWISRRASFHHDADGRPVRMVGTLQDITEQRAAQARMQAMMELGDVLRDMEDVQQAAFDAAELMARALGATQAGFGLVDSLSETVMIQPDWRAPGVSTFEGLRRFRDYGSFFDDLRRGETVMIGDVTADPRTCDHAQALLDVGVRVLVNVPIFDRGRFTLLVFVHYQDPHEWSHQEVDFIRSVGDRLQAAIGRLLAEQDQDILNRELSHRLKNTLSIVQAIATQTLKPITQRDPIIAFEKRLQALSSAHDVLIHRNWTGADLKALVSGTLDRIGMLERSEISGPPVFMGPKATQSVMLLLHELATNAVKYGSLSNDRGRIAVDWKVTEEGDQPELRFTWRESDGPAVAEPKRRGFGSRLIRLGLLGTGDVDIRYDPLGLMVVMTASLSHLQEAG
ncbi:GAF domain-containing protein [Neorhizobium sp. NPDC001467]|uniref:GAF domain-containing protein n=1 Tax=Neorhizobium sp. NPDC001467 TaxID=3390595 RepID=UPI003D092361